MQDTLFGEKNKGMYKEKSRAQRTASFASPFSIISYPHTQKQLLSLSTEGLEAQMIHADPRRAICAPSPFISKACYHLYIDFFKIVGL